MADALPHLTIVEDEQHGLLDIVFVYNRNAIRELDVFLAAVAASREDVHLESFRDIEDQPRREKATLTRLQVNTSSSISFWKIRDRLHAVEQ